MSVKLKLKDCILLIGLAALVSSFQRDEDGSELLGGIDEISALPLLVESPNNNPNSLEKTELGRLLFWDPILSGTKDIACATCHHPDLGYADSRALSAGVKGMGLGRDRLGGDRIRRSAPTNINTGFNGISINGNYNSSTAPMFWDNRASGLEEQALLPILSAEEMRGQDINEQDIIDTVVLRIQSNTTYRTLFELAFGDDNITGERITQSLANFQRSIISNNSRFDQYARGDEDALSNVEIRGMNSFIEAGCADCHSGPMFSDYELHTLSTPNHPLVADNGANGNFAFRTPTLRNLGVTAPYMHNGIFDDLREVLEFYDDISGRNPNAQNPGVRDNEIDQDARQLQLNNRDINEIIDFLNALNDDSFDKSIPENVPSGLMVGGGI